MATGFRDHAIHIQTESLWNRPQFQVARVNGKTKKRNMNQAFIKIVGQSIVDCLVVLVLGVLEGMACGQMTLWNRGSGSASDSAS